MPTLFKITFSLAATLVILAACARPDPLPQLRLEAESAVASAAEATIEELNLQGDPKVVTDEDASGGETYLFLRSGDKLSWDVTSFDGTFELTVRAKAMAYQGYPELELDAGSKRTAKTVASEGYSIISYGVVDLSNVNKLSLRFTNDLWHGSWEKDRNVYVDYVELKPAEPTGTPNEPDETEPNKPDEPDETEPGAPEEAGGATDIWGQFTAAKEAGLEPVLPDFSYAGYHYGERPIPDVSGPVFAVTDYGGLPDDALEDRDAIQAAVAAAEAAGGGVVLFAPGRFLLNETGPSQLPIRIQGSNIVLRGAGSGPGGTELFMRHPLAPENPDELYSTPAMFDTNPGGRPHGEDVTVLTADAARETFTLKVASADRLKVGQHIVLKLNDPDAADWRLSSYPAESDWRTLLSGDLVQERHQITAVEGNTLTLREPLHVEVKAKYDWTLSVVEPASELGIEDLAFVGGFTEPFEHHKNALHNSGYTAISVYLRTNSWFRNLRFENWSQGVIAHASSALTFANLEFTGNSGHSSTQALRSYGLLFTNIHDLTSDGYFHGPGVSTYSTGVVYHGSSWPATTSFDLHGKSPYANLYDRAQGGLTGERGGSGAALQNLPNHLDNLVLWNFEEVGEGEDKFRFWHVDDGDKRLYVALPLLVGYAGPSSFTEEQLGLNESFGKAIDPDSLYEAQLTYRLGYRPSYLNAY